VSDLAATTYPNLYKEIPNMFLECWDISIKAESSINEYFDLLPENKNMLMITLE